MIAAILGVSLFMLALFILAIFKAVERFDDTLAPLDEDDDLMDLADSLYERGQQ